MAQSARHVLVVGLYELPAAVEEDVRVLPFAQRRFVAGLLDPGRERLAEWFVWPFAVTRSPQLILLPFRRLERPVLVQTA